jgi:hypothetical protein
MLKVNTTLTEEIIRMFDASSQNKLARTQVSLLKTQGGKSRDSSQMLTS